MLSWLSDKWHAHQRSIDLKLLWPICCEYAPTIDHAKASFAMHAYNDPAWTCLGENEIYRRIEELRAPDAA
jgi:hypothetical protein